jgi:hypothetical protein
LKILINKLETKSTQQHELRYSEGIATHNKNIYGFFWVSGSRLLVLGV